MTSPGGGSGGERDFWGRGGGERLYVKKKKKNQYDNCIRPVFRTDVWNGGGVWYNNPTR